MRARPLTLKQANEYVAEYHRHHKPTRGHRFSIGAEKDGEMVGACIVGRPVSRGCDPYLVAEVTRLCVEDGPKKRNVCSFLYAAAARAAQAIGFDKIQTYILESEDGTTLRAAGWTMEGTTSGGAWKHTSGPRANDHPLERKQRWVKYL